MATRTLGGAMPTSAGNGRIPAAEPFGNTCKSLQVAIDVERSQASLEPKAWRSERPDHPRRVSIPEGTLWTPARLSEPTVGTGPYGQGPPEAGMDSPKTFSGAGNLLSQAQGRGITALNGPRPGRRPCHPLATLGFRQ